MNSKNKRKIASFVVASTILTVGTAKANAEETTYVVNENDTLGKISMEYYGNPDYYEEIAKYNNIENPNCLTIGEVIKLPDILLDNETDQEIFKYEDDAVYTVKKGDTLSCICNVYYGNNELSTIWKLATYNSLGSPDKIYEGQNIKLPVYEKLANVVANDYTYLYVKPEPPKMNPFDFGCEPGHHHPCDKVKMLIPKK